MATKKKTGRKPVRTKPEAMHPPKVPDGQPSLADYADARTQKEVEDAKYRAAKRQLAELELAEKRGELIDRFEVEEQFAARVVYLRRSLESLHRELPQQLEGLEPRQMSLIIRDRVNDLLDEYAGRAPAKAKRKRRSAKNEKLAE